MEVYYFNSDYIYEDNLWKSRNIFVRDGKFTTTFSNKKVAKEMNVDPFWIGPGKVYVDVDHPIYDQEHFSNTIKLYINRGCTLLLCQLPLESNFKFKQKFFDFKEKLSSTSPIDFMIVPRIHTTKLSIEQIKFFGRQKVPFILIDATKKEELKKVKWEWIQQTQDFSKTPIKLMPNTSLSLEKEWKKICRKYQLETFDDPINEYPISKNLLRLTGISPLKGEFLHQASADYNLFDLATKPSIDDYDIFRYHKAIPLITVSNGNIVKSNHVIHLDTVRGSYQRVSIPRHFV